MLRSFFFNQSTLGPTDCDDNSFPHLLYILSLPNCCSNSFISTSALVSIPYNIPFLRGVPSLFIGKTVGAIALHPIDTICSGLTFDLFINSFVMAQKSSHQTFS